MNNLPIILLLIYIHFISYCQDVNNNINNTRKIHKTRIFKNVKTVGTVDTRHLNVRSNANIDGTLSVKNIIIPNSNLIFKNGEQSNRAIALFNNNDNSIFQSSSTPITIDSDNNIFAINDISINGKIIHDGQALSYCDINNKNLFFGCGSMDGYINKNLLCKSIHSFGNLALGINSLRTNINGNKNTSIGQDSLYYNNGNNNIAIGYNAGNNLVTNESNNILIDNSGSIDMQNSISIGNDSHIKCYMAGINLADVGEDGMILFINSNGQIGVGNSSRNLKEKLTKITSDTSKKITNLQPAITRTKNNNINYKISLEDVINNNLEELLIKDKSNNPIGIKYDNLIILILNEVKNLSTKIEHLEKEIRVLKNNYIKNFIIS